MKLDENDGGMNAGISYEEEERGDSLGRFNFRFRNIKNASKSLAKSIFCFEPDRKRTNIMVRKTMSQTGAPSYWGCLCIMTSANEKSERDDRGALAIQIQRLLDKEKAAY